MNRKENEKETKMDKEKMDAIELTEKELEKVAGGNQDFWIDTYINCPRCGCGDTHAIRYSDDDCYYDVYCWSCGFYAAKL